VGPPVVVGDSDEVVPFGLLLDFCGCEQKADLEMMIEREEPVCDLLEGERRAKHLFLPHERLGTGLADSRSLCDPQRKNGLFKKAYELGVLCSVDIAVIVFGTSSPSSPTSTTVLTHPFSYSGPLSQKSALATP
jgi:hypothetical protein